MGRRIGAFSRFTPELRPGAGTGARAVGASALGALAVGATAAGAIAIGRLAIKRAAIERLEIEELTVGRLRVRELEIVGRVGAPAAGESGQARAEPGSAQTPGIDAL
jgi:hypothetical protein